MAELYRKRYNGVDGITLAGGGLTNVATAITFSGALQSMGSNIATLGTDEYLPLVIENEIVYLTAYTAGATTGTISRGKEGTTGAAHSSGVSVVHGATVRDFSADVYCEIYRNAAFTLSAGPTVLPYDSLSVESEPGLWDVANPERITIPTGRDGVYTITARLTAVSTGSHLYTMYLSKNGTAIKAKSSLASSAQLTFDVSAVLNLVAGDYITIQYAQNSGAARTGVTGALWTSLEMGGRVTVSA